MNAAQFTSIVRHLLTFAGGLLISRMNMNMETYMVLAGAIASLAGIGWSMWVKASPIPDIVAAANNVNNFAAINTAVDTELKNYPEPAKFEASYTNPIVSIPSIETNRKSKSKSKTEKG
jgi:hypothetical protein